MTEGTYIIEDNYVFAEFDEAGRLVLYLHYSDADRFEEQMQAALDAWRYGDNHPKETCLQLRFRLSDALEFEIDGSSMPYKGGAIDLERKPILDAMRAECVAMVARIDALKFA